MTDQYFADYQNEMSSAMCAKNCDGDNVNQRDVGHDSPDDGTADWIPLSELSGMVKNRKNSRGGRKFISALRQIRDKYFTHAENLTAGDSSGLLEDTNTDDGPC